MDRLPGDLDRKDEGGRIAETPAIPLRNEAEFLLERSAQRLAVPERLLNLNELDVLYDSETSALWTFMNPVGRPSFTPTMLSDFEQWQSLIGDHFGPTRIPLKYLILGSRSPGVFCFGGDLELFHRLIREGS